MSNLTAARTKSLGEPKPPGTTPPIPVLKKGIGNRLRNTFKQVQQLATNARNAGKTGLEEIAAKVRATQSNRSIVSRVSANTEKPVFEIIFVRHGESCGNALLYAATLGLLTHKGYLDPELTSKGRAASEAKKDILTSVLARSPEFSNKNYTIGSSPLIRAQETAYWMLSKWTGKPIEIMPYMGEFGGLPGLDNTAEDQGKQDKTLKEKFGLDNFERGRNERTKTANFDEFWTWAEDKGIREGWFTQGSDGVYRAIIFTHSNLLKDKFKVENMTNKEEIKDKPLHNDKLHNNDFLVTIYNPGGRELDKKTRFLDPSAIYPKWHYYDTRDVAVEEQLCGTDVRCVKMKGVPTTDPCKKGSGGKRKTRRLRRLRRLRRRRFTRRF